VQGLAVGIPTYATKPPKTQAKAVSEQAERTDLNIFEYWHKSPAALIITR